MAEGGGGGRGGAGGAGGGSKGTEAKGVLDSVRLRLQLTLLGQLLVRYPGLIGSIAVTAGYFLHIDALGNMHWNQHDALLGLQCALPILALDAALMLPDYSPSTTTKVIKLKVPRVVAEKMKQMEAEKEGRKAAGEAGGAVQGSGSSSAGGSSSAAAAAAPASSSSAVQQAEQQQAANGIITSVSGAEALQAEASGSEAAEQASAAPAAGAAAAATAGAAPAAAAGAAAEGAPAAGEQPDEDMVEVEKRITVRADQHPILAALYRTQMEKAVDNVGRFLAYPLELLLVGTWHLAEEMLFRAIILTAATGWTIDRLYEAGADEYIDVLGMQLATPQAGALFAAVGCTAASLALLVQRALFPIKLIQKAEEELNAAEGKQAEEEARKRAVAARVAPLGMAGSSLDAAKQKEGSKADERLRMRKVLEKVKGGLVRQRMYATAIEGTRDVVEWAAYSTSFLLTGNLLAPYITAVTSDVVFSGYQRLKQRQVDAAAERSLKQIKELAAAATEIQKAKKEVLQPPADAAENKQEGASSNGGSAPEGGKEEGSEEAAKPPVGAGSKRE